MEQSSRSKSTGRATKTLRGINSHKKNENIDKNQLAEDLKIALEELENARRYFQTVDDPELIEYAIYYEKAALIRVSYLLKKAKEK